MVIRVSTKTIVVLLSVILLVVALSGSVTAESAIYGVHISEAAALFGNGLPDHDNQPFTDEQIEEIDSGGGLSSDDLFESVTIKWDNPPEIVDTWNENNFEQEIGTVGSVNISNPPKAADVDRYVSGEDGENGSIEYGHATVHSITPSRVVHYHNGTEQYIPQDGRVRSEVDFLVNVPDNYVDPHPDENISSVQVEFSLRSADVVRYELLVDGATEDSASSVAGVENHRRGATLEFEDIPTDAETLHIEAEVRAVIQIEVTTNYADGSESTTESEAVTQGEITSRPKNITVESLEDTNVTVFQVPDGETKSIIESPNPISRYEVGGDIDGGFWDDVFGDDSDPDEVLTDWTFITTRNTGWDQSTHYTDDGDVINESVKNTSKLPIETRVYPSGHGPRINQTGDDDSPNALSVTDPTEEMYPQVELPNGTHADMSVNYTEQSTLETRHARNVADEDFDIYGLVGGEPHTVPSEDIELIEVTEGNLSIEIISQNMSREQPTEVKVALSDEETGDPINMDMAGGEITITDYPEQKSIDLGENGTATVRTNATGTIHGEYEPPAWTESEIPTTEDSYFTYNTITQPTVSEVVEWAVNMFIRLIPLFLVLYMITALREMFHTGKGKSNMSGKQR